MSLIDLPPLGPYTSFVTKSHFSEDPSVSSATYPFESIEKRLLEVSVSFSGGFGRQRGK